MDRPSNCRIISLTVICALTTVIYAIPTNYSQPALDPNDEVMALHEYLVACADPRKSIDTQLCRAYKDATDLYMKLDAPNQELLKESFSAFRDTSKERLCVLLKQPLSEAVFPQASDPKYKAAFLKPEICERICSELNDQYEEVVRPICKVITYALAKAVEAQKRKVEKPPQPPVEHLRHEDEAQSQVNTVKDTHLPMLNLSKEAPMGQGQPSSPVRLSASVHNMTSDSRPARPAELGHVPQPPVVPINILNKTIAKENKAPAKAAVTPSNVMVQSAEDVEPLNQGPSSSTSSTENPANALLIQNNAHFMDGLLENKDLMPSMQNETTKAATAASPVPTATGQGKLAVPPVAAGNAGSLDNETGGDMPNNSEGGFDEDGDGDMDEYGNDLPVEAKKEKVNGNGGVVEHKEGPQSPVRLENLMEHAGVHSEKMPVIVEEFYDESDSNFFSYFMFFIVLSTILYVAYHNKSKVLALMLEGRRASSYRGNGNGGRKKHTAAYSKLDSNLEEAITSTTSQSRSSQIIY